MLFAISQRDAPRAGRLVYVARDWAIDFETEGEEQGSRDGTILVRDLNIDFDLHTKEALTIWGYHPHTRWKRATLRVPYAFPGNLLLEEKRGLLEIVRLPESEAWQSQYDAKTRWLCVGDPQLEDEDQAVEFLTNAIAVIKRTDLKAIWLKPVLIR